MPRFCSPESLPLFVLAERGTQGGEYMWLKGENKGADSWKSYWDKQLNFKYIKISIVQDILYKFLLNHSYNKFKNLCQMEEHL